MMTGRERVIACLEFNNPDRVPRDLWALPAVTLFQEDEYEEMLREFSMDISKPESSPSWSDDIIEQTARSGMYQDDWGSIWYVGEPGVIGEVKEPAMADWSNLKDFKVPWHLIEEDKDISYINKKCENSTLFMLSEVCARPFERLQFLRGTENLFIDLAYGTKEVRRLLEKIHEFNLKHIEFWCKTDVDGIFMMDDWGTNDSLLISPEIFRELFKPLYAEYCEMIHDAGKYVFFHTDGNTESVYGDFVEVGIDAINSQLFTMDIEGVISQYKGKITFWGELDRQHVLPFGSKEEVREAVRRVRSVLDDGSGGVIAQCEWGKNNPTENIKEVFKAWSEPL